MAENNSGPEEQRVSIPIELPIDIPLDLPLERLLTPTGDAPAFTDEEGALRLDLSGLSFSPVGDGSQAFEINIPIDGKEILAALQRSGRIEVDDAGNVTVNLPSDGTAESTREAGFGERG